MATVLSDSTVLSDELLHTFGERAPTYDRENRFSAKTSTTCCSRAISSWLCRRSSADAA